MAVFTWWNEPVIRLRPATKTLRGSTVPDWENAAQKTIEDCSAQPSTTSLSQDGRVLGISDSMTLYAPYDADIREGDRIVHDSDTYAVIGVPKRWRSPTGRVSNLQASIERWSG